MLQMTTPSSMAASRLKYNLTTALGRILFSSGLWYWLLIQASLVQILSKSYISVMDLFICLFVTDIVRKMGARLGLAKEPLIPFNVQNLTFCLMGFPSSINDGFKRGCVTGDHSFKHSCFLI